MIDIVSLPKDVRALIISYIRLKSDLHNVYRTCKALYDVAIPSFYQHMIIRQSCDTEVLTAAFTPENAGLQHVRHATILPTHGGYHKTNGDVDRIMTVLSNLLPRDTLLTLTLDCTTVSHARGLSTLHRRQHNLRTLWTGGGPAGYEPFRRHIANVTCLHLEIFDNTHTLVESALLEVMPSLRSLELRVNLEQYCRSTRSGYNGKAARAVASRVLVQDIFQSTLERPKPWLPLRTLHIQGLDLSLAAPTLLKAVDMSRLVSLGLQNCGHSDVLLCGIRPTGLPLRMSMRSLMVSGHPDWAEDRSDDAIDDFLRSFCGLEHLVLLSSLAHHAATLQLLYLDVLWDTWPQNNHPINQESYDAPALKDVLRQCSKLGQLGLNTSRPRLNVSESVGSEVSNFADALGAAPSLRTLRLLDVPHEEDYDFDILLIDAHKLWVKSALQMYATEYLARAPSLKALSMAHGAAEEFDLGEMLLPPSFYSRGQVIDEYGKAKTIAMPMPKDRVQEIEPVSEILDLEPQGWRLVRYGYRP